MTYDTPKSPRPPRKVGPLAIAALLAGGLLQPILPAFAAGTEAGETISNTATATYNDGNGTEIEATSNTVSITVAEVGGLTAQPSGFNDVDGGAVATDDELQFFFDVTNVGNAPTDIHIPDTGDLTTQNFDVDTIFIDIDDGNGFIEFNNTNFPGGIVPDVDPDDVIRVRADGTPEAGTRAGDPVGVTLGDTGDNDNTANSQNQPDNNDPINGDTTPLDIDLRTEDANPGDGPPVNGEREASATQSIPFASSKTPVALAQVEKVASLAPGASADADDDEVTYSLSLTVEDTSPNAAFDPADLRGTTINLAGVNEERVLVSDRIPANTELSSVITPPTGWTTVYSTNDTNTPSAGTTATGARWEVFDTNPPAQLSEVKRIGFIYDATGVNDALPANGQPITPFSFTVVTTGLSAAGGQVANIAQVFGSTDGDPNAEVVYDESGDSNPNNFNDDGTPSQEVGPNADPNPTGTNYNPNTDTGVADPTTQGTDTDGDNTGAGSKGEANVINIGDSAGPDELLNGPENDPGAVGPTDSNDDFSNFSTDVPAGLNDNDPIPSPTAVVIDNTVQNPATSGFISDVSLEPISPTQAETNDESASTGQYGANADIPDGTLVTIVYDDGTNFKTATYSYTEAGGFEFQDSFTNPNTITIDPDDLTNLTSDGANAQPINTGNLAAGGSIDYQVIVQLPDADGTDDVTPLDEISIPIVAFAEDDPDGTNVPSTRGFSDESTNNITINRVYTGFMELVKEARILAEDGTTEVQTWTTNITEDIEPGQFIEYRISYQNISSPLVGSGNVGLTAFDFEVIEDGNDTNVNTTTGADNNWATLTTHQRNTQADRGSVEYFTTSADLASNTVLTTSDPLTGTRVEAYKNDVGIVGPQVSGQFQFRRILD